MERELPETPLEAARALWSSEALKLSPATFRGLFDRAYAQAIDLETLWQLGGAIFDFLRQYPGTLPVPQQLPWRLLQSDDVEARVVGLKLLDHIEVSDAACIDEVVRAIERHDGYESAGGLAELGRLLRRLGNNAYRIPTASAERLLRCLQGCAELADDNCRDWVAHLVELVRIGESITVVIRKGTVPFSSNENWDSPRLIHSPILRSGGVSGRSNSPRPQSGSPPGGEGPGNMVE
jgi:hypothetical protein